MSCPLHPLQRKSTIEHYLPTARPSWHSREDTLTHAPLPCGVTTPDPSLKTYNSPPVVYSGWQSGSHRPSLATETACAFGGWRTPTEISRRCRRTRPSLARQWTRVMAPSSWAMACLLSAGVANRPILLCCCCCCCCRHCSSSSTSTPIALLPTTAAKCPC